jgi:hypothetical protein
MKTTVIKESTIILELEQFFFFVISETDLTARKAKENLDHVVQVGTTAIFPFSHAR